MKYCTHCGTQLDDNALFCHKCGCACENYYNPSQSRAPESAPDNGISALAIVGLVSAFFLSAVIGLICSIVAYRTAVTEGNLKSKNFSKAGIIVSSVLLGLRLIIFILLIVILISCGPYHYYPYDDWYDYMNLTVNCL